MYRLTPSTSIIRVADGAGIPADPANTDYAAYLAWLAEGNTPLPVPPPTPEQVQASIAAAVQTRLDSFARTRGYDGILSCATYDGSANLAFAKEGKYAVSARDEHWAKCYEIMESVKAGTRPMPTVDEVLAEMPTLAWPL